MGNETFYGDGLSRLMKTNPKKMLCRKREISATPIQLHLKEVYGECYPLNRLFYSCRWSDLASEWQRGWSWPCCDKDLTAFIVQIKLFLC